MEQHHVTFAAWFRETWRRADEGHTRAVLRLSLESDLSPMTIQRALQGRRVRAGSAQKLSDLTAGRVTRESLAFGVGAES